MKKTAAEQIAESRKGISEATDEWYIMIICDEEEREEHEVCCIDHYPTVEDWKHVVEELKKVDPEWGWDEATECLLYGQDEASSWFVEEGYRKSLPKFPQVDVHALRA